MTTYLTKTIHVITIVMTVFSLTVCGFGIPPPQRHKTPTTWTRRSHDDVTTKSRPISFPDTTTVTTTATTTATSVLPRRIWNQILSGMIIAGTVWSSPASMAPLLLQGT